MASEDMTLDRLWEIVKGLQSSQKKFTPVTLPNLSTIQGRQSMVTNDTWKTVTVPNMTDYDMMSISYHHDPGESSNWETLLIPILELKTRGMIKFYHGFEYWNSNQACILWVKYINDTTLELRSGDGSIAGVFSPIYFMRF